MATASPLNRKRLTLSRYNKDRAVVTLSQHEDSRQMSGASRQRVALKFPRLVYLT